MLADRTGSFGMAAEFVKLVTQKAIKKITNHKIYIKYAKM